MQQQRQQRVRTHLLATTLLAQFGCSLSVGTKAVFGGSSLVGAGGKVCQINELICRMVVMKIKLTFHPPSGRRAL